MNHLRHLFTFIFIFLLAGCGGGGTGDSTVTSPVAITLTLQGADAATVKGIQATIALPAGVSLHTDPDGTLATGVITPSATAPSGTIVGNYSAATASAPASVTVMFPTAANFSAGDVMTITGNLASGVAPPPVSAYTISTSKLVDVDGNVVAGVSLALR
jgi:hypothetical protein